LSKRRIGEAAFILAAGTVAGNILQIVKLMIVSAWFGASTGILDQYFVALNIPLAFQGVVMGSLQASFIPHYADLVARSDEAGAKRMLGSTLGFGLLFFGVSVYCV
jgi:peptidoglycan biosynthesis protein MviN/MurJ (putative lipid II flippase)